MSSSGLIYAVIVGAWAAYLVPMWLRRQDELNEARPTERFSTAIRLLSGRAGMERRYARDLKARSTDEGEPDADPDAITDSVDVRAFAVPPRERADTGGARRREASPAAHEGAQQVSAKVPPAAQGATSRSASGAASGAAPSSAAGPARQAKSRARKADARAERAARTSGERVPDARKSGERVRKTGAPARGSSSAETAARAQRSKVLARRRRTTTMLFLAFTLGSVVAAVGGLAYLWAPGIPAVLLSVYIAHLRSQERRRFTYTMDRRLAEAAAQRLRETRRRPSATVDDAPEETDEGPEPAVDPGLSALAADRRALVEQTDHAEWVDQQNERRRGPGRGDSWDPVPVPLPTYVTAPVAPRATSDVDLGSPDAWSSARSSAAEPAPTAADEDTDTEDHPEAAGDDDTRSDARRAASARRARERGRTPLFDQYEEGERPRAANE